MDYKVEMKPTYWHVNLRWGQYSDAGEEQLFFAGNDEFEIWDFLKRYIDATAEENQYLWGSEKLALKWVKETYLSPKFIGDRDSVNWTNGYEVTYVDIKRLNVIYFKE